MLKSLEHKIKAAVFGISRAFLKKGRAGSKTLEPSKIHRVLFLRPEKIGDMVISLPVFDTLKQNYPHIKISVLASPGNNSLVCEDPRFERVFIYRKRLIRDVKELLAIRQQKFDCVFDMIDDDSVTTLFYSQLASSDAIRIGIGKTGHAAFYDYNHEHRDGIGDHIVDNTLKLLAPFGLNGSAAVTYAHPYVTEPASERIDRFMRESLPPTPAPLGINLSAGKPNRIWPGDRAEELCEMLLERRGKQPVVVIVAPGDRQRGEDLIAKLDRRAVLVPDGLSLIEVSALISKLQLLISPDTSLIHIARSFDVPVVGLYSRATKNFHRWRPYLQPDGAVVGEHIDNIYDITAEQVFERVEAVVHRVKAGSG